MALATRIKKLEQPAIEAWQKTWDKFLDTMRLSIPNKAEAVWAESERLGEEFRALPEVEQQRIATQQDEENERLFALLKLESEPWLKWAKAFDEESGLIPIFNGIPAKPDLSFTPSSLTKPPCDPRQMLKIMETFDYPVDFIGHARFHFVFLLAEARAVWEAHEGLG